MTDQFVSRLQAEFTTSGSVISTMASDTQLLANTDRAAQQCISALQAGNKILLAGNGGSAADAQHIAAELVGRYLVNRASLPAIALTTDTSALTAIGNDYGFDHIFSRQMEALARPGDVFFAYSTSGGSSNILNAIEQAKQMGVFCIAMTGNRQGAICQTADLSIEIPSGHTPNIQEGHLVVGHAICGAIEYAMFAHSDAKK